MKIKKILTVESFDNDSTRQMLKTIYDAPLYKDYEISHYFFLSGEIVVDEVVIYDKLRVKIEKFEPNIVLFHTGNSFIKNIVTIQPPSHEGTREHKKQI